MNESRNQRSPARGKRQNRLAKPLTRTLLVSGPVKVRFVASSTNPNCAAELTAPSRPPNSGGPIVSPKGATLPGEIGRAEIAGVSFRDAGYGLF